MHVIRIERNAVSKTITSKFHYTISTVNRTHIHELRLETNNCIITYFSELLDLLHCKRSRTFFVSLPVLTANKQIEREDGGNHDEHTHVHKIYTYVCATNIFV